MDVSFGIQLPSRLDKDVDKFIVLLATYPRSANAQIELVVQELMVLSGDQPYKHSSMTGGDNTHQCHNQGQQATCVQDECQRKRW